MADYSIREWNPDSDLDRLAELLHACVQEGASVSFVLPFSLDDAKRFWREKVIPVASRRVLVAETGRRIAGTVQLDLGMPPNQRHRAEISKLLVHPEARRKGIARALMLAIEQVAVEEGRTLLTLDTRRGDSAEPLYLSLGYVLAGMIPRYARGPLDPKLEDTSILYKELS